MSEVNWIGFRWATEDGVFEIVERSGVSSFVWIYKCTRNGNHIGHGSIGNTNLDSIKRQGLDLKEAKPSSAKEEMMDEKKKLSDAEIADIRRRVEANYQPQQETGEPIVLGLVDFDRLLNHIAAMKAEHDELVEAADLLIEEKDEQLRAFRLIEEEINRQNAKWGDQSGHPMPVWYTILGEEVGEVAQAILQQKPDECLKELVQVAAVAVQMLQSIQTRKETEDKLTKL